jgi:hypothetical protein
MFDNEIDWVTRLEIPRARREARQRKKIPSTFEYKAEHKQLIFSESWSSGKCSSKKSVFRSVTRMRVSASELFSGGFIRRLTLKQDRSDSAPCTELILWSSY